MGGNIVCIGLNHIRANFIFPSFQRMCIFICQWPPYGRHNSEESVILGMAVKQVNSILKWKIGLGSRGSPV